MTQKDISVILLAGGRGSRMGATIPKQFLFLDNRPIATYSLEIFLSLPEVYEVIVVADPAYYSFFKGYPVKFALPGLRRQDSLHQGFLETHPETPWICTHDTARPFISSQIVKKLFEEGKKYGSATLGLPVKYTVKESDPHSLVRKTLDRSSIWEIQTPQFLSRVILEQGLYKAINENITVTDDTSLAELIGKSVFLVPGSEINIKITTPHDLHLANAFCKLYEK
jgi:2-C-methyl-D-erythritol 4-phosphate cytidylyltransferase